MARRARLRKAVFRSHITLAIAQYPLEIGLAFWGFVAVTNLVAGSPPSNSLQVLPNGMEQAWAILMAVAALTVTVGLVIRRLATIATGMYVFATILLSYSAAIISSAGWRRGGTIAALLAVFGAVSLLRGWWLKEQDTALVKELKRSERTRPEDA